MIWSRNRHLVQYFLVLIQNSG